MAENANEDLFDAALRHQVAVRRFTNGEVKAILALVEKSDFEIVQKLRNRLRTDMSRDRLKALLTDMLKARSVMFQEVRARLREQLTGFARVEVDHELGILKESLPFEFEFAVASLETLRAAVISKPFAGGPNAARTLQQWFDGLQKTDQRRLIESLQLGLAQSEPVDDMVRRVAGTRARGYADGVLAMTRLNAEAVVRTAANHVSNVARESLWAVNESVISYLRWTSTLDGRTSAICRARDGGLAPVGDVPVPRNEPRLDPPGARPPAHPNCRSVMVGVFDVSKIAELIPARPTVRDTRTRRKRERDFRAEAKDQAGDKWGGLSETQRAGRVRDIRNKWADESIGQATGDVTYQEWLKRQPAGFQDDVLGKAKGQLFRMGVLTLDKFIDKKGAEMTLDELRLAHPESFTEAGV